MQSIFNFAQFNNNKYNLQCYAREKRTLVEKSSTHQSVYCAIYYVTKSWKTYSWLFPFTIFIIIINQRLTMWRMTFTGRQSTSTMPNSVWMDRSVIDRRKKKNNWTSQLVSVHFDRCAKPSQLQLIILSYAITFNWDINSSSDPKHRAYFFLIRLAILLQPWIICTFISWMMIAVWNHWSRLFAKQSAAERAANAERS